MRNFKNADLMTSARIVLLLVVVLACGMAGCMKLERPSLDRKYFTLDVVRTAKEKSPLHSNENLIVRRVKISPRYEDRDLVYKTSENSFEADYYNSFFIPPASMLTQELRLWMRDSGLFANVLGPDSLGTGELLLEGVVNSIYGDYSGPTPKAVIRMQFILLNNDNPDMPIIYSQDFSRDIVVEGTGPEDLIRAMSKGLKGIFAQLEEELEAVLKSDHLDEKGS